MDDFFREKFADFEYNPPEHIWLNVKKTLHKPKGGGGGFSGGKMLAIAITLLIAGSFTLYMLLKDDIPANEVVVENNQEISGTTAEEALFAQNMKNEQNINEASQETTLKSLNEKEYSPIEITVPKNKDKQKKTQQTEKKGQTEGNASIIPQEKIASSGLLASAIENNMLIPGKDSELLAIHDQTISNPSSENKNTDETTEVGQSKSEKEINEETQENQYAGDGPEIKSD